LREDGEWGGDDEDEDEDDEEGDDDEDDDGDDLKGTVWPRGELKI
jgi:hypothetical protein